ncbi:hypothetical protein [Rathayibacter sp. AY1C5]|uniref:hypothetical protein n=1 Tax=Rathayibacter sp. AY1C5 TaxID=2080538 RepID=UPI000CE7E383|nr:hypothetical protein [Rathayibacter sp. AY1C5]PPG56484.1 hypothetical protein C5C57_14570 [Rathayibacter sp. AY1C5]
MSDHTRNPDDAADAARRLLEQSVEKRVEAVRTIVSAANDTDTDTARATLSDAQNRHSKAWADALAAGWSEKELRAAGVPRPEQTRARVTRSRRTTSAEGTTAESTQSDSSASIENAA